MRSAVFRYTTGVLAALLGLEKVVEIHVPTPVAPEPDTPEQARYYARMYDNMAELLEDAEARAQEMVEEAERFLRDLDS